MGKNPTESRRVNRLSVALKRRDCGVHEGHLHGARVEMEPRRKKNRRGKVGRGKIWSGLKVLAALTVE